MEFWKSSRLATSIISKNHTSVIDTDELNETKKKGGYAMMLPMSNWTDTSIRGYANSTSVNAGSSILLYVATSQATYTMEVYRMGWYGGTGARLLQSVTGLKGINQPVPVPQATTGLIEANWQSTYTLQTNGSWVSGSYLVKLIAANGTVGYIIFVLRNDGVAADLVYQLPLNTYQAYNDWGGKSLYDYNSDGGRAYKVSYDRPYADDGTGLFFAGDYGMIRWMESNGYNVTYATSIDTVTNPNLLSGRKVFVSNYHDEYWSKPMRDNLMNAFNQGKSLAFFSANNIYWQARFENSTSGVANRVMTCYKDVTLDPVAKTTPALATINWRDAPVSQPENALLGVMYESQFGGGNTFPWVVSNANSWVYSGTGLKNGDAINGLVGYEYDKVWNNGLTPAGLTSLSNSPIVDAYGVSSFANGSVYQAANKAFVFTAGTIYWAWKLDNNDYQHHGVDWRVQQMTANVLGTMVSGTIPPLAPSPTAVPSNPAGTSTIYDEVLASGWADWSWGGTIKLTDTLHPYTGKTDISWAPSSYGAVSLSNTSGGVTTVGYRSLSFALQASAANESASINVVDGSGYNLNALALVNYGGNPVVGSYKKYTIPLIDLGAYNTTLKGIQISNQTNKAEPVMYIDTILLDTGNAVTTTPTAVAASPTVVAASPTAVAASPTVVATTPTVVAASPTAVAATPTPGSGYSAYDEGLASGWQDWSWSSTVNVADTSNPYSGQRDIAWTPTSAYAGLYLANPGGLSMNGYSTLTFAMKASAANESASVSLIDASNTTLATLPLASYGGDPVQGSYKVYSITLANFNAVNKTISAIQISNQTSGAQPTMYVDRVVFV